MTNKLRKLATWSGISGLAMMIYNKVALASVYSPGGSPLPTVPPISVKRSRFSTVEGGISTIFNVVIGAGLAIFAVLLLIGGIQYLTAAGNEEATAKAKKLLVDSIIGLVIVLSAWAIGQYVIRAFVIA